MSEKKDFDYKGLWLKENANGKFLSGYDKEAQRAYMVFTNDEIKRLVTKVGEDGPLVSLGDMKTIKIDGKEPFHVIGDVYSVGENQFYQDSIDKGVSNPPTHMLKINLKA